MDKKINVAGLFVGCGGLDIGFARAGFNLHWANDWDSDSARSYKEFIGHSPVVGDIWDHIDSVPKSDVIIGGPPCQAFSLVGKRLQDDPRGKLVFAFQKIIEKIRPKIFVLENVPGMMASRIEGERLPIYLARNFEKLSYHVTLLKLNATDYFVPQQRVRVFMIGHLDGFFDFQLISSKKYASILQQPSLMTPVTVSEALDDLPNPLPNGSKGTVEYTTEARSPFAQIMHKDGNNQITLHTIPTMSKLDKEFVKYIPPGGNYMDIPDEISTTRIMKFKSTGGRTTTYGRLHPDRPSYTINTYFNRPNVGTNYHHREERLITPREALRLQSFPDNFTPFASSQRSLFMQIGNAVPPLLSQAIAESIMDLFK